MRRYALLTVWLLLGGFWNSSCFSRVEGSPDEAYRLVKEEGALMLDVRTPDEFSRGRIEGARNVPVSDLSSRLKEIQDLLGGDRTKPIVVYCTAGARAARAEEILRKAGFAKVVNLGGLANWPERR